MTTTTPTIWSDELLVSASDRAWASSIAALADGGFAVVWNDYPTDIFGQRFTAVGAKTGVDFLAGISVNAAQAWDTVQLSNGSLVVGFNYPYMATDHDVFAGIYTGPTFQNGTNLNSVNTTTTDHVGGYVERTREGFLVLYREEIASSFDDPYYLQRMSASGAKIGAPIAVLPDSVAGPTNLDVTVLTNGNIVVSWADRYSYSSNLNTVQFRIFDPFGNPLTGALLNKTSGYSLQNFEVEALSNGNFVLMYANGPYPGFYHQVYSPMGVAKSDENYFPAMVYRGPIMTELKDGGYMIAWTEYDGSDPNTRIAIQRFNMLGEVVGEPLIIDAPGEQDVEHIESLADGRVVLTYISETDLKARIIDPRESWLVGTPGNDAIVTRRDDSHINGFDGNDALTGMEGDDELYGQSGNDTLLGGAGDDKVIGGSGNDIVDAGTGDDEVRGGAGNDFFYASLGDDSVFGGSGADTLSFATIANAGPAVVNLAAGSYALPNGDAGNLTSIEIIIGTDSGDTITGNVRNNNLNGAAGNDTISGGAGNDVIVGSAGKDRLAGDAGNDIFSFKSITESAAGPAASDAIVGFTHAIDKVDLSVIDAIAGGGTANDAFVFPGGVIGGAFTAAGQVRAFQSGADTVIEVNTTGASGAEMSIVLLGFTAATLTAVDFTL